VKITTNEVSCTQAHISKGKLVAEHSFYDKLFVKVSEDFGRTLREGEIKSGLGTGCDDSNLVWKEKKKEAEAERKKIR
jgi:hypothetical protein